MDHLSLCVAGLEPPWIGLPPSGPNEVGSGELLFMFMFQPFLGIFYGVAEYIALLRGPVSSWKILHVGIYLIPTLKGAFR